MSETTQQLLLFGAVVFVIGLVGFLTRRSMILMFLSLEMMLAGVSINLVTFARHHQNYQGQVMAIMILAIAACEAAIALAMVVSLYRRRQTLDIFAWSELTETPEQPRAEETMTIMEPMLEHPKLTPAGLDPAVVPIPAELGAEGWTKENEKKLAAFEETQHV